MKMQKWYISILSISLFLPLSFLSAGTILSSYKYAWSNNLGYINFENVIVSNDSISGYAWSANAGWIKFDPAQGGVFNDGTGNLSGSAWGTNLGWIDFNGVSIDGSTGKFSGTASGELVGIITFDCGYCDVRTDWRQVNTSSVTTSNVGGGSSVSVLPLVSVSNTFLTLNPQQAGTLTKDTPAGRIVLEIPKNAIPRKTTFTILHESQIESNEYLLIEGTRLVNSAFYNILAKDDNGKDVHFFSEPITITLPLPVTLADEGSLTVYWLNETNGQWVLIPDAVFSEDNVKFTISHLTKFAIFTTKDLAKAMSATTIASLPLVPDKEQTQVSSTTSTVYSEQNQNNTDDDFTITSTIMSYDWNSLIPLIILFLTVLLVFLWKKRKGNYY